MKNRTKNRRRKKREERKIDESLEKLWRFVMEGTIVKVEEREEHELETEERTG